MTLAELKLLLSSITQNLKTFGDEKNISQAVNKLHKDLEKYYSDDPDGPEKISLAMKEVTLMVRNYMSVVQKLQQLQGVLQNNISQAEEKGISDEVIMNVQLPLNYINDCNSIVSVYAAALMQINIVYNQIHSNQVVYLSPEDLLATPPAALNNIMSMMSGHSDLFVWNEKLESANHTKLDKNFICEGFYKDHDNTYFQQQIINPIGRRNNFDPAVAKKCSDFVDLYLDTTELPDSVRPNLLGLLSVLAYQSGVGGILYDQGISNVHVACEGDMLGEAVVATGGQYTLQFYFEPNGDIKVACMSTFYPPPKASGFDNGIVLKDGINFVQGVTFDISCNYSFITGPIFTIKNFQRNLSCFLDESHLDSLKWIVNENTLSTHHQVDKKYFSFFGHTVEYLIKFAGFKSIEELAEITKITPSMLSVFSAVLYEQMLGHATKALSPEESAFFESLSLAFYRDHKSPQQIAKQVTDFFLSRFFVVPNEDKTRYLYLLKMAVDFVGFNYGPVKEAFQTFLDGLAQNPPALLETLKKDIDFYHLYLEETNKAFSWFSKLPKFSKEEHFAIMRALNTNNDYFHFLAKNPQLLQANENVRSFLKQLPIAQKMMLLSDAKKAPELLKILPEGFFGLSDHDAIYIANEAFNLNNKLRTSQIEVAPEVLESLHSLMQILENAPHAEVKPQLELLQLAERVYLDNMATRLEEARTLVEPAAVKKPRAPIPLPEQKPAEVAQKPEKTVEKPKKSIPVSEVTETELEGTSPKELYESFQTVLTQAEKQAKPYVESKKATEKEAPAEVIKEQEKTQMGTEAEGGKKPSGKLQG